MRWSVVTGWLLAAAAAASAADFTEKTRAVRDGGTVKITFAASAATDVEVAVIDQAGEVVRHLAAGMLGQNAPGPLKKGSLRQEIRWDLRDDAGKAVSADGCGVRVRLGMSVKFDRIIGWHGSTIGEIKALAVDSNGDLYCLNGYGAASLAVFSREGKYLRTILPHNPNQPAERLTAVKTLQRADGVRVPLLREMRQPVAVLAKLGIGDLRTYGSMVVTPDGKVLIAASGGPCSRQVAVFGKDGSLRAPLLTPAVLPEAGSRRPKSAAAGVRGLAISGDGKHLYASGIGPEQYPAVYRRARGGGDDGPEPFLGARHHSPREPDNLKDPRGVATDQAGRIYVCDHGNDRVAVFGPDGRYLASIPAPGALWAAVGRGGAVYVVAKRELRKVSSWRAPKAVWTLPLPRVPGEVPPVFALDGGAPRPVLWIGCPQQRNYSKYVLWRIEDLGGKPGEPVEISDRGKVGLFSPVHLAADPVRDEVYVREWRESLHGQVFRRFEGGTGRRTDLKVRGNEAAVGPDGLLYVRGFHGGSVGTYIQRFDHDGKAVPFTDLQDKPAPARKRAGLWVLGSLRGATAVGMKGFCVAPSGDIYVMRYFSARGGKAPWIKAGYKFPEFPAGVGFLTPVLEVYSSEGRLKRSGVIKHFRQGACGVRVDRAGNIYVADNIKPPDRPYPADLASQLPPIAPGKLWDWPYGHQNWYLFNCGALMKFGPAGGTISTSASADDPGAQFAGSRSGKMRYVTVSGAIWRHVGISPVPADTGRGHGGGCVCANARFDIDAFGRVYVPDVLRFAVDVLDSGGNAITSFGRYGNADCRGPDVALAWGAFVGCSNKAVYVCDAVNRRIVRAVPAFAAEATCAIVGPGR